MPYHLAKGLGKGRLAYTPQGLKTYIKKGYSKGFISCNCRATNEYPLSGVDSFDTIYTYPF